MAETGQGRGRGASSRGSQVYDALLARIRAGVLQPGMRLREEDLGAELGVSRTPVREALARLQERGLVESAGAGLAVAALTRPRIVELYAMRAVLEGAAARLAAQNASAGDLAGLGHVHGLLSASAGGAAEVARLNLAFHEAICEAAHNGYLSRMLADLTDSLALLPSTTFSVPGRIEAARAEHDAIFAAIAAHDPERAEQAARAHIDRARDARLALLFSAALGAGQG
ncbi:GntR family transcriptional regulator [Solirhodobacter olei]|uniref:GntR family transcriptional regulator n=1 Tax=Solirhodobacter olei TaxID=2493082 RepID=UPI000FD6FE68|nr:GntR family transcriptional regulator [Solirhodobacter olei]